MLTHPTIDLLHTLGLDGMAKGFKALEATPETRDLEHAVNRRATLPPIDTALTD